MLQHKLLTILSSIGNVKNTTYYFRDRGLYFRDRDPQEEQGHQSEGGNTAAATSDASGSQNRDMPPPDTIPTRHGYGVSIGNVWEGSSDAFTHNTGSWDVIQGTR